MNKLSDKIRIVSSDGKPVNKPAKKSAFGKTKGLFGGNKKVSNEKKNDIKKKQGTEKKQGSIRKNKKSEDDLSVETSVDKSDNIIEENNEPALEENNEPALEENNESALEETTAPVTSHKDGDSYENSGATVTNRLKGLLDKDRKEVKDDKKLSNVGEYDKDISKPTSGQSVGQPEDNPFKDLREKEEKKTATPLLIGIILGVTIIGIAVFVYLFSSSAIAAVQVEPKPIENSIHKDILDGGLIPLEEEDGLVEVEEDEVEEDDKGVDIVVDTPQDKEKLEKRVEQLEVEIEDFRIRNNDLGEENEKLIRELNKTQRALDALKVDEEIVGDKE